MQQSGSNPAPIPAVLGPYRLAPETASFGATGVVVRGVDQRDGRVVALKIPNQLVAPDSTRERLAREAATLRDIGGRHSPGLVAEDVEGETPYIAMEYVPHTIAELVADRGRLAAPVALRILRQLTEALVHLHDHGIVHRDLSPANVGLTADLEPRLLDFGIAVTDDVELGGSTAELGTPQFTAPERLLEARHDNDPRTDLYALGCLAYYMLDGRPPLEGSRSELLARHQAGDLVLPATVPERLRPILERLLNPQPALRYSSSREVLAALDRLPAGDGSPARGGPPRSTSALGGWWGGALPASFGLAVAAFVLVLAVNQGSDSDSEPAAVPPNQPISLPSSTPAPTATPPPAPAHHPIEGWSEIVFNPPLTGSLAVASTDRRLYIAQNGTDTNDTITVWSAVLYENGTVGSAVEEATLITGRDGFPNRYSAADMAIVGDCLFVLPATTNSDAASEDQPIEWARIDPNTGALSPFEVSTELLTTRRASAALHPVGDMLYAIAGFQVTESDDRRSVEYTRVAEDCSITPWVQTAALTEPIADPRVAHLDDTLYVVGGSAGDSGASPKSVVQRATIEPDGSLGAWIADEAERLLEPRYEHDLVAFDGHLIAIGGQIHTTGESPALQLASVEVTAVNDDGSLAGWEESAPLPEPRSRHRAVISGNHIILFGGNVGRADPRISNADRGVSTNTQLTPLDPPIEVVDDAPPMIRSVTCSPREPLVGEEVTCSAEVDGRTDTLAWAGTSLAPVLGPSVTVTYWTPITATLSLAACNTAGCDYADANVPVGSELHFWQQHAPDHPASVPPEGGDFRVSLAIGTRDVEIRPEVTFRLIGPDFEAELEADQCAAARHPWGLSRCMAATFTIPAGSVTEPTLFTLEATSPLVDDPISSEILISVGPEDDGDS